MKKSEKLTQQRLKELLHYDPETGIFTRKIKTSNRIKIGDITGYLNNGYIQTRVDGKQYFNHRLAWLYVYGYFPENNIDHKDRIKHHNWIDNLRESSQQCNLRNTGNHSNNTSGVKGVYWNKKEQKWLVQITVNNKNKYTGLHKNFDEAVCHRLAAEQCLGWEGCDSNSPAYQYVRDMLKHKRKDNF